MRPVARTRRRVTRACFPLLLGFAVLIMTTGFAGPSIASGSAYETYYGISIQGSVSLQALNYLWSNSNPCGLFQPNVPGAGEATWQYGPTDGASPCSTTGPSGTITLTITDPATGYQVVCTDTNGSAKYVSPTDSTTDPARPHAQACPKTGRGAPFWVIGFTAEPAASTTPPASSSSTSTTTSTPNLLTGTLSVSCVPAPPPVNLTTQGLGYTCTASYIPSGSSQTNSTFGHIDWETSQPISWIPSNNCQLGPVTAVNTGQASCSVMLTVSSGFDGTITITASLGANPPTPALTASTSISVGSSPNLLSNPILLPTIAVTGAVLGAVIYKRDDISMAISPPPPPPPSIDANSLTTSTYTPKMPMMATNPPTGQTQTPSVPGDVVNVAGTDTIPSQPSASMARIDRLAESSQFVELQGATMRLEEARAELREAEDPESVKLGPFDFRSMEEKVASLQTLVAEREEAYKEFVRRMELEDVVDIAGTDKDTTGVM